MRVLLTATIPNEPFGTLAKQKRVPEIMSRILEDLRPEAVYFYEDNGKRTAMLVVQINDTSQMPKFAEPFFLTFNAEVRFRLAMTPDDLQRGDVSAVAEKWTK